MLRTAILAACLVLPALVSAHQFTAGSITIDHPTSRPTPKAAKTGVGYLSIFNAGTQADRLVGGSAEASERLELHVTEIVDGVARMRPVEGGVVIEPGATIDLASGGIHIMLGGLKGPLVAGESFQGELVFEKAGAISIEFNVERPGVVAPTTHEGHPMGESQ
ncbi:copper chaperone PCu(A)C [Aurantimonas aggregata]|uniref:Copper chaperone PCu(A)C n=1 Tax=Aurantimonas aggregata TaxID=2047720 RepID=A0A6L9MN54_9HYPH|nr:copper chaperone PCu(A)C [Aurantimonas aggregata]